MNTSKQGEDRNTLESFAFRMLIIFGVALFVYLLGFSMLVLFPQVSRTLGTMGISDDRIEAFYFPVIRLLE